MGTQLSTTYSTSLEYLQKFNPNSMSLNQLKAELKSQNIDTRNFNEKSEFVTAVLKYRKENNHPYFINYFQQRYKYA